MVSTRIPRPERPIAAHPELPLRLRLSRPSPSLKRRTNPPPPPTTPAELVRPPASAIVAAGPSSQPVDPEKRPAGAPSSMSHFALELEKPRRRLFPDPAPRRGRLWFSLYCLTALAAIFWLPCLVPVAPSYSYSYAFGYNNQVGLLLTVFFAVIAVLWLRPSSLLRLPEEKSSPMPRRTLLFGLAGTLLLCAAAYPLVQSPFPVRDAGYILNRLHLLAAGQKPYLDFEFPYGPLFLYPPVWIAHLFHLGLAPSYYAFWVLNELAGVFLLFRVIDAIDIPSPRKSAVFFLFCAASGTMFILGALSYTFLRFALAPWLAFRIVRAPDRTRFALAALSYALLLLVSPEIALSFAAGSLAFLLLGGHFRSARWWAAYAAMIAAMAAATALALRAHLFATLASFAGGALDFPLAPAGHLLLFFACLVIALLHLVRKLSRRQFDNSVYLVLISLPMLASALGCCDPLHVLYAGFGLLLVGLLYLSRSPRWWNPARLVFFVFFVLALFSGLLLAGSFEYQAKLRQLLGRGDAAPSITQAQAFPLTHGILEAPWGFRTQNIETYSLPWVDTGRYLGTINAHSLSAIAEKERELDAHPDRDVLVPAAYNNLRRFDPAYSRTWLEIEFAAPFWMPLRNPVNPWAGLAVFLETHYHRVLPATAQSYGYEVWSRNR